MRVLFFGSGAFGAPTLRHLHETYGVCGVVSQPDRPAGRKRRSTPTPISEVAISLGLTLHRFENVNTATCVSSLHALNADAWVVIAFGQKLSPTLLDGPFAINLHASLLPRWRGAAPIHHAIMAGDSETGVSVITLAQVMDAGLVLGQTRHPIGVDITTGELHDSLAQLGPALIGTVLDQHASGEVQGIAQDPELVCAAPRLSRSDAVLDLQGDADTQRCRINGLSPWPGCRVLVDGVEIRLLRAAPHDAGAAAGGFLSKEGVLGLGTGAIRILEVQPAGGRAMPFETWANGRRFEAPRAVEVPV